VQQGHTDSLKKPRTETRLCKEKEKEHVHSLGLSPIFRMLI